MSSYRKLFVLGLVIVLAGLLLPVAANADIPPGTDPNFPIQIDMKPKDVSTHTGLLAAGEEAWFSINVNELEGEDQLPLNLTVYTYPGDGNALNQMNMELFNSTFVDYWSVNDLESDEAMYFGRGFPMEHETGNPFLGSLGWTGDVINNEAFFVCLRNDNEFPVSYWFYTGEVLEAELGEPEIAEPVEATLGTDPNFPLPLHNSANMGTLEPEAERWYALHKSDLDDDLFERMDLTLYFTPNDGNNIHQVDFDIYEASQCDIWARGDGGDMRIMGAGAITEPGDNYLVGRLAWSGYLVDNDLYIIRVRNNSPGPIDYWFFTEELLDIDLSAYAQPEAPTEIETEIEAPRVVTQSVF